jgi:hypothetical protein
VPYYLLFYPDNQELTLFQHTGRRYRTVEPNEHGRYPIPDLDIEVGLLDGWVRYSLVSMKSVMTLRTRLSPYWTLAKIPSERA